MATEDRLANLISPDGPQAAGGDLKPQTKATVKRRSFLKGVGVAGVALSAGSLLPSLLHAQEETNDSLTKGDAAILRFLAAAEILESDLWEQYWELSSATGVNSFFEAPIPQPALSQLPLGGTRHTRPLFRSWMATCPSTLTTIPMTNSATRTSFCRT